MIFYFHLGNFPAKSISRVRTVQILVRLQAEAGGSQPPRQGGSQGEAISQWGARGSHPVAPFGSCSSSCSQVPAFGATERNGTRVAGTAGSVRSPGSRVARGARGARRLQRASTAVSFFRFVIGSLLRRVGGWAAGRGSAYRSLYYVLRVTRTHMLRTII